MTRLALIAPLLALVGCSQPWNAEGFKHPGHGGIKRAAFEMECTQDKLQVIELGEGSGSVGVTGCGKKAVYKWVYGAGWVNNTGVPEKQ